MKCSYLPHKTALKYEYSQCCLNTIRQQIIVKIRCIFAISVLVQDLLIPELGEWTFPNVWIICAMLYSVSESMSMFQWMSSCGNLLLWEHGVPHRNSLFPLSVDITDLFDLVSVIYPLTHKAQPNILGCPQITNNAEHLQSFLVQLGHKNKRTVCKV